MSDNTAYLFLFVLLGILGRGRGRSVRPLVGLPVGEGRRLRLFVGLFLLFLAFLLGGRVLFVLRSAAV